MTPRTFTPEEHAVTVRLRAQLAHAEGALRVAEERAAVLEFQRDEALTEREQAMTQLAAALGDAERWRNAAAQSTVTDIAATQAALEPVTLESFAAWGKRAGAQVHRYPATADAPEVVHVVAGPVVLSCGAARVYLLHEHGGVPLPGVKTLGDVATQWRYLRGAGEVVDNG